MSVASNSTASLRPRGVDVWTVSRLNHTIREQLLASAPLRSVWVEGEVTNLSHHRSGHIYFSLKDNQSVIRCTFFRNANLRHRNLKLSDGMQVLINGSIGVFLQRGEYQLNVNRVMLAGEGELRARIEILKQQLHREGLFESARKRELPPLPMTLGIATAPTGAAIQDIIRVARQRFPRLNILLAPCRVQGPGAAESIVAAIQTLNDPGLEVDVIVVGRGGGSFEDLIAFNEEAVVRAIANSTIPIVSAVGHEIDHPLSDFAADASAPTPTAAAELIVPSAVEILSFLADCDARLRSALRHRQATDRKRLQRIFLSRVYANPRSILNDRFQALDRVDQEMRRTLRSRLRESRLQLHQYNESLPRSLRANVREGAHRLHRAIGDLPHAFAKQLERNARRFALLSERLQNFHPLATLSRGFAVVRNSTGEVIRESSRVNIDEELEVILHKGRLKVQVQSREDV